MLEGLEVSEIQLSALENEMTIGSEYYSPIYLRPFQRLITSNIKIKKLAACCSLITDGDHGSAEYVEEGITFVLSESVKNGWIDESSCRQISLRHAKTLSRSVLRKNDVLVTKTGIYFGRSAVVTEEFDGANTIAHVGLLRFKPEINPYYISTFFNCNYGYSQLRRRGIKATRPEIKLVEFQDISVGLPSTNFQSAIENVVLESQGRFLESKFTYSQAELFLLEAVGLADFKPSTRNTNIKTLTQSFGKSHRLDAEYYQPKYEEVIAKIVNQPHAKLSDVVSIRKSIEPGSDAYAEEGLPFIRVSDYSKYGLTQPDKYLSESYCVNNKELLDSLKPKAGTVLFSKDGSVGTAYLLREDLDGVTSGAILHLVLKREDILPEYLTLVLNSKLVQMQAERDAGGSIILHWRVGEIENVVVPVIDTPTQSNISELMNKSFTLRVESERLLRVAKRAVEVAIEQNEAAALAYIKQEAEVTNGTR